MRMLSMVFAAASASALLAASVEAQQRPFQRGGVELLQNVSVQKELKLTDEQIKKSKEAANQVRQKYQEAFSKIRELTQEEQNELRKKVSQETLQALKEVLKPGQVKRLKQIELQQRGLLAFQEPEVDKALKLTEEQKAQIKTLSEDLAREMRGLFQGGDFQEAIKKVPVLRRQALEKGIAVLTAEQKKAWQELTGEPFEVKIEGPLIRPRDGQNQN